MTKLSAQGAAKAFTLIELLLIITIGIVLAALLVPVNGHRPQARQAVCLSNLRHNTVGFWVWAGDHDQRFPWQFSTNVSGTQEWIESGSPLPQFQTLSKIQREPHGLRCPADRMRLSASSFNSLSETNISYFVNADAVSTNAQTATILLGDRHLSLNGGSVRPGLFVLARNANVNWTRELHANGGGLAFVDGHAQFVKTHKLTEVIHKQPAATSRLLIP